MTGRETEHPRHEAYRLARLLEHLISGHGSNWPGIELDESDARTLAATLRALVRRLDRAEGERSGLIGQRIVEDGAGRGWWAYAEAPEDEQGWPDPVLCLTWDEAVAAILSANGWAAIGGAR